MASAFWTVLLLLGLASLAQCEVFIKSGMKWKYFDKGTNLGTNWRKKSYNTDSWKNGPSDFGFSACKTVVNEGYITYYFRRGFYLDKVPTQLVLRVRRDDGAVVYINGREVFRTNMPTGTVLYDTRASSDVRGSGEVTFYQKTLTAAGVVSEGRNVIAVEVHQSRPLSGDFHFDLELDDGAPVNTALLTYLQGLTENPSGQAVAKSFTIDFKGTPLTYWVKAGVIKKPEARPSFAKVETAPQEGWVQLVSMGTSDGWIEDELVNQPVNKKLMELQGFELFTCNGSKDARAELWARRYDSSLHSPILYLSGDSKDVAWMVYALPLSSSNLAALRSGVKGESSYFYVNDDDTVTIPLRPSSGSLKFVAMFFDDTNDIVDPNPYLVAFSGQGDGDTFVTGLWGSEPVPSEIKVVVREDRKFNGATITAKM